MTDTTTHPLVEMDEMDARVRRWLESVVVYMECT